jgi:hypothetical protein
MKKLFIFLLAITIAFLAFWLTQKPEPIVESPTTRETEEPIRDGTYCYYRNQIATPSAPYAVEEHIELLVNGNNITGKKTGTQSGPDMTNGFQGTLSGSRKDDNLNLVFSYTIEGSENKEEEIYKFYSDRLEKLRYTLKESKDKLIPDLSSTPQIISYTKSPCKN